MIDSGLGDSQINTLISTLNVPAIPSTTLKRYERKVGVAIEAISKESCEERIRLEKKLTLENMKNKE